MFSMFWNFIFRAVRGVKGQKIAQNENNYIWHMPYLRNSIAYDNDFWYKCVKWWYLQVFFSLFWNFQFLSCRGAKGNCIAQNKNSNYICLVSYQQYSLWSWFLVHLCKMMISLSVFSFLIFSFFELLEGGKRAKNGPRWQKHSACCTSYLRNHTSYDLDLWYICIKG